MKKNWRRHLLVGVIVGLIFFGWFLRGFLWMNWRFKLFSTRSWSFVLHEFRKGWMLDALSDWIFLFTICSALPCFLYLWYLCAKVRWRTLIKKILKKIIYILMWPINWLKNDKKIKKQKQEVVATSTVNVTVSSANKTSQNRPRAMSVQNKVTVPTRQYTAKTTFQMPQNSAYSQPVYGSGLDDFNMPIPDMDNESYAANADISQIPLEEVRLPERKAVVENLDAILAEKNYSVLKDVALSSGALDYVAVNKETIYACKLDKEPADWLADEESFNGEDPLWFSEVDHRVSPVFILKRLAQELKKRLGSLAQDFTIKPLLIEQKGNIINAEDMMKSWLEMGVFVCRTDVGGPDDLSVFNDFLKAEDPVEPEVFGKIKSVLSGEKNNG